jgi:hypothetical protein
VYRLATKFSNDFNKVDIHNSQNGCTSNIFSGNSNQTLKFAHLKSMLNSYAPQILTQPYIYLKLRKYVIPNKFGKGLLFYNLIECHMRIENM